MTTQMKLGKTWKERTTGILTILAMCFSGTSAFAEALDVPAGEMDLAALILVESPSQEYPRRNSVTVFLTEDAPGTADDYFTAVHYDNDGRSRSLGRFRRGDLSETQPWVNNAMVAGGAVAVAGTVAVAAVTIPPVIAAGGISLASGGSAFALGLEAGGAVIASIAPELSPANRTGLATIGQALKDHLWTGDRVASEGQGLVFVGAQGLRAFDQQITSDGDAASDIGEKVRDIISGLNDG